MATPEAVGRLLDFERRVEAARIGNLGDDVDPEARAYYAAARSASNDAGPRRVRIDAIKRVLRNGA